MSTHLNNSCSVYLLEDGLELWLVALQNSKHLLPQWMQLASNIPPILELSSENLRTMIYIVQAYIVLAPNEFVATCGASVMKPLDNQYGNLKKGIFSKPYGNLIVIPYFCFLSYRLEILATCFLLILVNYAKFLARLDKLDI